VSEPRLFTPDEVDRLIPRLTELMETAIERYGQALALQERLRDDRARVSGADFRRYRGRSNRHGRSLEA